MAEANSARPIRERKSGRPRAAQDGEQGRRGRDGLGSGGGGNALHCPRLPPPLSTRRKELCAEEPLWLSLPCVDTRRTGWTRKD